MSLYDLSSKYLEVYNMDDVDAEAWTDTLDAIDEAIEAKADNIGSLIRSLEADAEMFKKEADRFSAKKKIAENKVKSLKKYVQSNMELLDKPKIKTDRFTFGIRNNAESVEVLNEDMVPDGYTKNVRTLDKSKIKADLQAGHNIKGVELKRTQSLIIK
ncbi:Siphovirus Gp157 [Weissella ceti]|uniref:siphovirus Gp157 family protein n=1 Tax=Weissella ceti TaxID=759620 RepID=UPI0004F67383|nr:siphovirus Gp157 family protein [Weissella ceti]AIM64245.1 Siphovirus Gp157 [Weissella ceti]